MAVPIGNGDFFTCDYPQHLLPISCIAAFSYGGGVRPQYIQITFSDGRRMTFQIGKIHQIQDHKNCDITFTCDILDGQRSRQAGLYFDRKRDRWVLRKDSFG